MKEIKERRKSERKEEGKKERKKGGRKEGRKETFLIHFPNILNSLSWARQKPGNQNPTQTSRVGGRDLILKSLLTACQSAYNRKTGIRNGVGTEVRALWYGI